MNTRFIQYNLQEIEEEVDNLLKNIRREGYSEDQFFRSMQHLFHHANVAWNARHASTAQTESPSQIDLRRWDEYPTDLKFLAE